MVVTAAYYLALLAALTYVISFGGRTGRWGGLFLLITSVMSLVTVLTLRHQGVVIPVLMAVDVLSLGWKLGLAYVSSRRWPIWVAGFQMNIVAAHLTVLVIPSWRTDLYYAMITVWAMPTLLVMVLGTALDSKKMTKQSP